MKKIFTFLCLSLIYSFGSAQTVIYSNNFDTGVGAATIVGSGQIESNATTGFGSVFHNGYGGTRANYLLLTDTVFGKLKASANYELTITFWVNKDTLTKGYFYTPLFSAYKEAPIGGANTWPMMIVQSRLLAQVNCAGWTDLTNVDNVNGTNTESTTWLDDGAWHYYTATFDTTSVKIYIDGVIKNSWNLNGTDGHTVKGLFTNGSDLKYICLGGNQAWDWNDVDPAYLFDDLTIYSDVLTDLQISANIAAKQNTTGIKQTTNANSQVVSEEFFTISGVKAGNVYNKLKTGIYLRRTVYSNGTIKSTKIVKTLNK